MKILWHLAMTEAEPKVLPDGVRMKRTRSGTRARHFPVGFSLLMAGCAQNPAPETLDYRDPPAVEVMVRATESDGVMSLKPQLEKRIRKVKVQMDVVVRCVVDVTWSVQSRVSQYLRVCFATDPAAEAIEGRVKSALENAEFVPARVDYEKTTARFLVSARIRTGEHASVDVWLHHGNVVSDGDTTYQAPQYWPSRFVRFQGSSDQCLPLGTSNQIATLIDAEGKPIAIRSAEEIPDECSDELLRYVQQMQFFPAMRDGKAVAGVFPLLTNDSATTNTWPGPIDSYGGLYRVSMGIGPDKLRVHRNYRTLLIRPPLPRHAIEDFKVPAE
ncbi:MAG: hypothetical protein AAF610_12660 [Pseudomonadota bacterium]